MMYLTSGDKRYLERVTYIVDELKKLQDAEGQGYIGVFPNCKKILSDRN